MSEIRIEDSEPWYLRQRPGTESRHLQVWCGNAYLLVRKEDGYTDIGYQDEGDCRPTATSDEIADWLKLFWWRASQVFPYTTT
jgi:hypothetical protein